MPSRTWDRVAVTASAALNFSYGVVSWTASVAWGRDVLFTHTHVDNWSVHPVEYYAAALGLMCFHAAALAMLLRDGTETARILHLGAQAAFWALSGALGIYFGVDATTRPEVGFVHAVVAGTMCTLALLGRRHIILERVRADSENKGGSLFSLH